MWEQRYDALTPVRSEGNTRYYDSDQLRRLLNIVSLSHLDYKISELCSLPDEKLFQLVAATGDKVPAGDLDDYYISQLIAAGMSYDEAYFEKIFSHCLLSYGMKDAYLKLLYPVLMRIGMLWACDVVPPAHEHFIMHLVRQKLCTAIDLLPPPTGAQTWLLFLPEDEFHETGLLFASYLIRLLGGRVIYLGSNLPYASLQEAVKDTRPDNLLLFLVRNDFTENYQEYIDRLSNDFKKKKIFVAGSDKTINPLRKRANTIWLTSAEDLEQQFRASSV